MLIINIGQVTQSHLPFLLPKTEMLTSYLTSLEVLWNHRCCNPVSDSVAIQKLHRTIQARRFASSSNRLDPNLAR
jgi:hypothetical protein